eukprot:496228_1
MAVILLMSIILVGVFGQNSPPYNQYWYTQRLDHYNPQDTRTFEQRYLVYDGAFDKSKNVIFFYAGNEGNIESFYNNTGFMFDNAPQFGALVLFAEHRYYGETHPFGEDFSSAALQYLTIENAVADYAQFMTAIKNKYSMPNAKVIVFGGSYGGILAALCRIHYPAIFSMSLAASAPIPETLDATNATVFFQLVTEDYYNVDTQCPDIVRSGYSAVLDAANSNNYKLITDTFNLCSPLSSNEFNHFIEWSRNALLTMAMVDYPYSADFLGNLPAWPVNVSCDLLIEYKSNPMKALSEGVGLYYNASYGNSLKCFNLTAEYIECADQTGCGLGTDSTAWNYQMCTEVIASQQTNNITDMFPPYIWDLNNLTAYCKQEFGVIPQTERMQIWFPLDISENITNKIIFSNGLLDPWRGGGYMKSLGPELPVVIIPSGAHHLDLRGKNPADPPDVTSARQKEVEILQQWLKEIQ